MEKIYFTSGACESNNWVIRGFDDANINNKSAIITTPIEHKSILEAINNPALQSDIHICKVDHYGFVDIDCLKNLLDLNKDKRILVSVIMANNEIGTIQDIKKIADLVHSYNGILHTDATQAFGHIPIDVKELGIDLLSASAQKLGGLKGTGFLYNNNAQKLRPLIYGAQENGYRGGTENVIGIIALGEAIKHIDYNKQLEIANLRDIFIKELLRLGCNLNGSWAIRLPNNINVRFKQNITGEAIVYGLDTSDIYISTGSACNSKEIEASYVLKAIGLSDESAYKSIRITLPDDITRDKIDKAIQEIKKLIQLLTIEDNIKGNFEF